MSDKGLKILLRVSVAVFILSLIFCITVIIIGGRTEKKLNVLPVVTEPPAVSATEESTDMNTNTSERKIIVLDAGHGKSSELMSRDERLAEGYEYNESSGSWGEWRHYKSGTFGQDCYADGCTGLCPSGGRCWYTMSSADRDTEPDINLNNAYAAKRYLEQMGYEVRMTRESNEENPSMNKRVSYCFPDNNITSAPDASAYICIHSNAGGGHGTSYIRLDGPYDQAFIDSSYISSSNRLGEIINGKVAAATGLSQNSPINSPYLILFNKCPVPIAYMEIGFFDDSSDLAVLRSSSEEIGRAIAEGVDEYFNN